MVETAPAAQYNSLVPGKTQYRPVCRNAMPLWAKEKYIYETQICCCCCYRRCYDDEPCRLRQLRRRFHPAASESTASSETASGEAAPAESEAAADFDTDQDITVISREDGSGTRGAFIELTGVEEKNADGQKIDNTTEAAAIQSSTNGVMTAVANDETAIGYISLGSLNDSVKAVKVGGIEASAETVKDGSYTLARPFNIVTNGEATDPVAVDFIAYCLSKDGQALATEEGYVGSEGEDYTSAQPEGKINVGGSSSVSPLMEKLIEAYKTVNPNAELELLTSDSTTGVFRRAGWAGYTIGMASRELKDSETEGGAVPPSWPRMASPSSSNPRQFC